MHVSSQKSYNDKPIEEPSEDRFGLDPFAKALSSSMRKLSAPEGTVIALNGPWGSAKSSTVNLSEYHLQEAIDDEELAMIASCCWWFPAEEALECEKFRESY